MARFIYKISTRLKDRIKDPKGYVVDQIITRLGLSKNIRTVVGSYYKVVIDADTRAEADKQIEIIAQEVLINPIVETYEIESFEER